jgi:hypothetical protein
MMEVWMVRPVRSVSIFLTLSVLGCAAANHSPHANRSLVSHIVVCWLKSPGDASARRELIDKSHAFLGKIPGLIQVYTGEPLPSTRPVVDTSYDVAVAMIFKDEASLRNYEMSAIHQKAVRETLQPLVAKLVVYDFSDRDKAKGTLK